MPGPRRTRTSRLGASFVLALIIAGCFTLWIGAPAGALWLAGKLATSSGAHLVLGLALSIAAMLVVAVALAWLNSLYLRMTGGELKWNGRSPIRRRGPLEPLILLSMVIALVAAAIWFFVFAENPAVSVY